MKNNLHVSLKVVQRIWKLWQKGHFQKALDYLDSSVAKDGYTEELLIYKANLIQLTDSLDYTLEDVEEILKFACESYPDSAAAHFELGKFYDVVMSDQQNGLKCLNIAKQILQKKLDEVEKGIRECTNFDAERDCSMSKP